MGFKVYLIVRVYPEAFKVYLIFRVDFEDGQIFRQTLCTLFLILIMLNMIHVYPQDFEKMSIFQVHPDERIALSKSTFQLSTSDTFFFIHHRRFVIKQCLSSRS